MMGSQIARVRIAGPAQDARRLAMRLTRAGIAATPDDGEARPEILVALEPTDLAPLRARATRLIVVGVPAGPAFLAGADDVITAGQPQILFRRVRAAVERADVEARNQRLVERIKALEEGLAEAAHDLRSPLHACIGHAELLAHDDKLDTSQRQSAEAAARQANRALANAERILAAAGRPEGGELELRTQQLGELLHAAVAGAEAAARARHISISALALPRAIELRCDPGLVSRILDNLIANALRHTQRGGEVEVSAWRASPRAVRLCVRDTGSGIEPKQLSRLVAGLGTGRGLRICREIAERHGGDLWAESTPSQGSRFIVELPLSLSTSRPHVLLVSDDGKWVREVARALKEACDVSHVGTARARLGDKRTDLVLVEAPQKGKVRNLTALRNAAKGAQVPVIELPSDMAAARLARALFRLTA